MTGDGGFLGADARSQYDGSDTVSMISSDDDHWGTQIGGYNEYNAQYPPPPVGLFVPNEANQLVKTVAGAELEAMLDAGFDTSRSNSPIGAPTYAPRYQASEGLTGKGYTPMTRATSPGAGSPPNNMLSPTTPMVQEWRGGQPSQRHPDRYGPLGPLDPTTRF